MPVSTESGLRTAAHRQPVILRESLARLATRPRSMALLVGLPGLVILAGILGWILDWQLGVDSAVYRAGAATLLQGDPLYDSTTLGAEPWWALLPFTYPPTAALLFIPLAVLPVQVTWGVLAALSLLAMAAVIRVTIGALPSGPDRISRWASPARTTLIFSVLFVALEPVWRTLMLGQINLLLMALIVLDVLVVCPGSRRWGGALTGVAAAVKLTPLIFIPHLLFTGRYPAALRALGVFLGFQALMFLIIPGDSYRFWTHTVFDQGRIGPVHWAGNQSLNGLVNRVFDLASWSSPVALAIGAALAPGAVWLMLRFHRRGNALAALLVTAFYALLISPVSWSHHWVWAVPLIVLLVSRLPRATPAAWKSWLLTGSVIVVFVSCVLLALPNGRNLELHWTFWQYVLGSAYLLVPLGLTAALGWRGFRRWKRSDGEHGTDTTGAGDLVGQD